MYKKTTNILFFFIVLFGLFNTAYASIGKYVNNSDSSEFIELYENKQFFINESGTKVKGTYDLQGPELILSFKFNKKDYTVKALYEDGIIKDSQGKIWVKDSQIPPLLISVVAAVIAIIFIFQANKIKNKYLRSLLQLASIFVGVLVMVPFSENAVQARTELGKYYFYSLIVAAILSKLLTNKKKMQSEEI